MQIPQTVIDEVVQRADIVEVIGKHLKLKRSGHNYFACCPFHQEKSPSFAVNATKQIYHCFGCSESGNVISFIMKYLGFDFVTAVTSLATQYGVHIALENEVRLSPQQLQQRKQQQLDLQQTMQQAKGFYIQQLSQSSLAKRYLEQRGLSNEVIKQFELGFALNDFQALAKVFKDYKTNQFLLAGGLVIENESAKRYDRFRERIIFPIKNIKGEVIGFGGRILVKGEPKYLNSPETELFSKSKELYGLFEAKQTIRELNSVIVVEGYLDVITLNQYGVKNVVATMGTAITEEHIKILFRLSDNICYAFDGDNAGKKAAWRACERSVALVTDVKSVNFLFFPAKHDPDSYIREYGVDNFKIQVKQQTQGIISFILNQSVSEVAINTDEGKARLISLVKPYLEQIKAVALQVMFKKQLANIVDLDPSVIESILNNRSRFAFYNRQFKKINLAYQDQIKAIPLNVKLLEGIIFALFSQPKLAREYPIPEAEILQKSPADTIELFKLINYLELHCDEFNDINLSELLTITQFSQINLTAIYQQVQLELINYTNVFSLDSESYRAKLKHLIYAKKRILPPKLN